jgi:hypothetical protein
MTTIVAGTSLRLIELGTKVDEAAAVLPATATGHIFTVSGGRVAITALIGLCTTVCSATATTLAIGTTPSVGTASTTSLASATAVTSKEVGTMVGLGATAGAALIVGTNAASPLVLPEPVIVSAGTIDITTSAANTGAFSWSCLYIPIDDGATVTGF